MKHSLHNFNTFLHVTAYEVDKMKGSILKQTFILKILVKYFLIYYFMRNVDIHCYACDTYRYILVLDINSLFFYNKFYTIAYL